MQRVLVVDDDQPIVDLLVDILSEEGYRVRAALDGLSMLQLLPEVQPNIILLDWHMPQLDGGTILDYLRTCYTLPVAIIVMTADQSVVKELEEQGLIACLAKPFDIEALLACVEQAIASLLPRSTSTSPF